MKELETKPIFVRRNRIKELTGLSPSTVWRLEQQGQFPKRRKIGPGCTGWLYEEVLEFLRGSEKVS
ncbi:helix-turn-helix transcriptional regulator [Geothermobacter hydrogeniphilus]|uniref:Transcriptional regulator, AlpA family n=1 Tax=Geothermobacter hydrogeniphilus TaxID=1969733 RepID=A0A1X0XXA6_9BACT|nr:AlpA family phage regulatory protein [Geothermobacter hydrogeniphilus]ORJ57476.1 hypothetical protein B5V00_13580 [Geothermobacter hydrogeniphilus]